MTKDIYADHGLARTEFSSGSSMHQTQAVAQSLWSFAAELKAVCQKFSRQDAGGTMPSGIGKLGLIFWHVNITLPDAEWLIKTKSDCRRLAACSFVRINRPCLKIEGEGYNHENEMEIYKVKSTWMASKFYFKEKKVRECLGYIKVIRVGLGDHIIKEHRTILCHHEKWSDLQRTAYCIIIISNKVG